MVVAALSSPAVRLAATAPHHKEMMVAAPVGAAVIEGYVDLLIEQPDGRTLETQVTIPWDRKTASIGVSP